MEKHLRILILEDSPDDVLLIQRELQKGEIVFTSSVVKRKDEFVNGLRDFQPDVVLSDHSLPAFNSVEALEALNQYEKENDISIPFILITGTVSEEFAVYCLKAGVDDFILKDRLKRLPSSVRNALEKKRIEGEKVKYLSEVVAREALMKQAESIAHFGSWEANLLTGIYKWSDETFRIYGYEPGEIEPSYEVFLKHVHPDDVSYFNSDRARRISSTDAFEHEFRVIDKGGNIKYLASKVMVERNEDREAIRLIGVNLDITERKRAQTIIERSEQEYKSLFDRNPDAVYSLDLQGRFTKVNDSLIRLSGLTEPEIFQQSFQDFIPKSDLRKVEQHLQLARQGQPQHYHATIIDNNGKQYLLDITNIPIVIGGEIVGVHGVAKDITAKIHLEHLLDKVHRLARIGGWEFDVMKGSVTWTSITKELHEVNEDYVPDFETVINFYKEGSSRETISDAVRQALKAGKPFDLQLQIITAKGNLRWIRVIGESEFREERCLRLYGSFQDIHERKTAEETARKNYAEKTNILESIGDAFFAVDKEWTVTYWNKMAELKLQMPRSAIIGKNLWEVYGDAVSLDFYKQYHRSMSENVPVHFQEFYPALNVWIEVSAYPSDAGLAVYFRDITQLRKHSIEIEDQNIKLTDIAWILSHEVRAPLARIMGLIQLVNDYPEQKLDLPDALNHIRNSAHELDSIVRKIVRKTEELNAEEPRSQHESGAQNKSAND